jgi:formate dehydrogenase accessory protein FdhD
VLEEIVAQEVAVALVYNGISYAVMMVTPCDLEDLARGFSLTEGIIERPSEIYDIEVEPLPRGVEVRVRIASRRMAGLQERRRSLAGRTSCGLCGVDSLEAAMRPVRVSTCGTSVSRQAIELAMASLPSHQHLNRANGAAHAAGWAAAADGRLLAVREDVGRHNALDKLGGALICLREAAVEPGFVVVTSRCSYEMVHKAAALGAVMIASVSAPTSLAIETAERAGIALAAFVRDGRLTAYACAERVVL